MKRTSLILMLLLAMAMSIFTGCSTVEVGHVGIKVDKFGSDKGVQDEVLGVGWYWIGPNEKLYVFPTFRQNYVWTQDEREGSPTDESITFQSSQGMVVGADVGISYEIKAENVPKVFQTYRRGVMEITDTFLRNAVRDAFVAESSTMEIDHIYGEGKAQMMKNIIKRVQAEMEPVGIDVNNIYFIGDMRLPKDVIKAIGNKIAADQDALKAIANARESVAKARGDSLSSVIRAAGLAQAMKMTREQITDDLVAYEVAMKWNGILPLYTGGSGVPLLNLPSPTTGRK